VSPANSVVLEKHEVPVYLQKALKAMALHVEARTSFITYWLPALEKHDTIALRFLPQAEYEQAAKLSVAPAPDVVTRVFMLFRGLKGDEADMWRALSLENTSPETWSERVGVGEDAWNERLFRVLEWGGMEVV
ncbi:hypothetical protein EXIGLDRAFT_620390, partial [Exidia glandulosa HHB12029]